MRKWKKKEKKKKDYYTVKGGREIERKERQRNREAEIERHHRKGAFRFSYSNTFFSLPFQFS